MRACRMLYAVIGFIANTNMKLLWDVNGLACRTGAGPWSPECNATAMLGYIDSKYGIVSHAPRQLRHSGTRLAQSPV